MFSLSTLIFCLLYTDLFKADDSLPIFYDLQSYSDYDIFVYLLSLQGKINQFSSYPPKLFFQTDTNMQFNADIYWSNTYFPKFKNISFNFNIKPNSNSDICTLTNIFITNNENLLQNTSLIIYDATKLNALQYLAMTYSSCIDKELISLPVSQKIYDDPNNYQCLKEISIIRNLTNLTSIFNDNLDVYQWMINNLMSECNNTFAFVAGKSYDNVTITEDPGIIFGVDIAISLNAFIFNVSPDITNYYNQSQMFLKIMKQLRQYNADRIVEIYGWTEPEPDYVQIVSKGGNIIFCAAAPNLSFWNKIKVDNYMRLPNRTNISLKLNKNKYYIAFQTNEGDTPKLLDGLYAMSWNSSLRGSVPISWGIDPRITRLLPAMFEYYVKTCKYNDSFFAGTSGSGYCYPFSMPNFEMYADDVNYYLSQYGPQTVDVWPQNPGLIEPISIGNYSLYDRYTNGQITLFTQPPMSINMSSNEVVNLYINNTVPLVMTTPELFYPVLNKSDPSQDLINRILKSIDGNQTPLFLLCYGLLNDNYYYNATNNNPDAIFKIIMNVQNQLSNDKYNIEVVSIDNLAYLAKQYFKNSN